jgi:putative transcriptional regulator
MAAMESPMVVVETETFLASAKRLGVSEKERTALIIYLATNPEVGRVVPETGGVRKLRWAIPGRGKSGGAQDDCSDQSRTQQEEIAVMTKESKPKKRTPKSTAAGRSLLTSLDQALAYARGEHVPGLRVTHVRVDRPAPVDLPAIRQNLGLSQSRFATRFGFSAATIKDWEQGRTRPDGPARILLAVIATLPTTAGPNHSSPFTQNPQLRRPVRERQAQPLQVGIPGGDWPVRAAQHGSTSR